MLTVVPASGGLGAEEANPAPEGEESENPAAETPVAEAPTGEVPAFPEAGADWYGEADGYETF